MKKSFLTISVLLFLLLSLQIYLSCTRSTDGDAITDIQSQIAGISSQNQALEAQIFTQTSIEAIQAYAQGHAMKPAALTNLTAITVASLTK